jgi:hypothetical protein
MEQICDRVRCKVLILIFCEGKKFGGVDFLEVFSTESRHFDSSVWWVLISTCLALWNEPLLLSSFNFWGSGSLIGVRKRFVAFFKQNNYIHLKNGGNQQVIGKNGENDVPALLYSIQPKCQLFSYSVLRARNTAMSWNVVHHKFSKLLDRRAT